MKFILLILLLNSQQVGVATDPGTENPTVFDSRDACYTRLNKMTPLLVDVYSKGEAIMVDCVEYTEKLQEVFPRKIGDLKENS